MLENHINCSFPELFPIFELNNSMAKLNDKKIRWILRHYRKDFNGKSISLIYNISKRRIRQLSKEYRETGKIPVLNKPGRKKEPITQEEMDLVMKSYRKYRCNAVDLEELIMRDNSKHIPHNKIHKIMLKNGLAKKEPNKGKRRKWVRYERKHSMELWHTDWKQLDNGKWLICYEDDASRMIMGYGMFEEETTENSITILEKAIKHHGLPNSLLTDRGSQFYASESEKKEKGISMFENFLSEKGINHILGRVKHPQTNGKIERFYGVVQRKLPEFNNIDELMVWYNNVKPHRSLKWEWLETPSQAFIRKMPAHRVVGMVNWW